MTFLESRTEFDGYKIEKLLGEGGMGAVYLAKDTLLDRQVAIKFILNDDDDPTAHKRFMVEAKAIARLQHPNVLSIYRVGEVDGYPYLVSEFIRGTPLDKIELPVSSAHALKLSIGIACGLAAAHKRGVLHRDIKPANAILSDDGEVKLLDFGIAKFVKNVLTDNAGQSLMSANPPYTPYVDSASPADNGAADDAAGTQKVDMAWVDKTMTTTGSDAEITDTNTLLGTPAFMAPELWLGAPASFRSDIYAFGMLIYTLLTGRPAHQGSNLLSLRHDILSRDVPSISELAPHVDPEFAQIIGQCLERNPELRHGTMNEVRSSLERLATDVKTDMVPQGNPYRGLNAFEAADQNLFFGRDSEIRLILERLRSSAFVLVTGDSGVGKSSLCRAGILPRVKRWLDPKRRWQTIRLVPGSRPVRALSTALASIIHQSETEIQESIRTDPAEVSRMLRAANNADRGIVIFIDQLEELVTISDPEEAGYIAELLGWLIIPSSSVRLLATARGDFLSRLAGLPHIGDEISRVLFFARSLSSERIREAIVGPVQLMGVTFESQELVDELVDATERAGGGLPLLQFALAELWTLRDKSKKTIPSSALEQLGGVGGALTRHADNVIASMRPKARIAAQKVLIGLVTHDETRARRTGAELGDTSQDVRSAIDALVRGRLVVAQDTPDGAAYEIAHEALIHGWTTLARWLSTDAESRLARERLRTAVKEWERLNRPKELLWQSPQLREVQGIPLSSFTEQDKVFIDTSKRGLRRTRFKRFLAAIAVPLVALVIYGGTELKSRIELNHRVDTNLHDAQHLLSKLDEVNTALKNRKKDALHKFDTMSQERAEVLWKKYLEAQKGVLPLFRRAGRALETALLLDPHRSLSLQLFSELLYQRALFLEQQGDDREAAELISRLSLYDKERRWINKWQAPGQVTFDLFPKNAKLEIIKFVTHRNSAYTQEAIPISPHQKEAQVLAAGSYIVIVSAPGHATVRYPFVVHRQEEFRVRIVLPLPNEVPKGFIYIPPGKFHFGSDANEGLRKDFFHTTPLHEIHTDGYLIGKHETTFAEWISYLESFSKDEQKIRLPRVEKGGFQGALQLTKDDSGKWRMSFQATTVRYEAIAGETIKYQKRTHRKTQDWLRFPVVGITSKNAVQYANWLATTGRVPGARLCTDFEWERAARGADLREYPHGERMEQDDANFDGTYAKVPEAMGPDEVGAHPISLSPFGLSDMSGNVWEWVKSSLVKNEYAARGGSYLFGQNSARVTDREVTEPSFRDVSVGMRLCADGPWKKAPIHAD